MTNQRPRNRARGERGPAKIAKVDLDLSALNDPLIISELSETPRRTGRFRVSLNGIAFGDLTLDFVADQGIREGKTITHWTSSLSAPAPRVT